MADFSRPPQEEVDRNRRKGYVGMHFQQGVPILDRDLNLLQDLVASTVRSLIETYIGNGVRAGDNGFEIQAIDADNDFLISGGGSCLVGGIEVTIAEARRYSAQGLDPLETPPSGRGNRIDVVFLDVFLETVDDDHLPDDYDDVGILTSVRLQPAWSVQVAEDVTLEKGEPKVPAPAAGHARYALAQLDRPAGDASIKSSMITDLRQTGLNLDAVERRMRTVENRVLRPVLGPRTEFSPPRIGPGGSIHILGRNLDLTPVTVAFGDVTISVPNASVTPTDMVVQIPVEAAGGSFTVTVTTAGGTTKSAGKLTIDAAMAGPVFDAPPGEFSPPSGPVDTEVTLHGRHLGPAPVTVRFGDVSVDGKFIDETKVSAKVPGGLTQPVKLTLKTGRGDEKQTELKFVPGSGPVFAQLKPIDPVRAGHGSTVTLNGSNFASATVTFINEAEVEIPVQPASNNGSKIEIPISETVPVGKYTVKVETPVGSASKGTLTITP
jgi:hypothetical protein